jgi:excisionase family DNA binding protein
MITVAEAARKVGRDPETIRRWIRSGRLRARKVGTQHVIEEAELLPLLADQELPVPDAWQVMPDGSATPNVVRAIRLSRVGR